MVAWDGVCSRLVAIWPTFADSTTCNVCMHIPKNLNNNCTSLIFRLHSSPKTASHGRCRRFVASFVRSSTSAKGSTILSYVEVNLHHQCVTRRLHRGQNRRLRLGQSGSNIRFHH